MNANKPGLTLRYLWLALGLVVLLSFGMLLYFGGEIYQLAPPIPERVVTSSGDLLFTGDDIWAGQDIWRSIGGQELGSIWGHGAYTAPDWTADWLHREGQWLLHTWAVAEGADSYADLEAGPQAVLRTQLQAEMRTNTYDPATQTIVLSPVRAQAIRAVQAHYTQLFGHAPELNDLRDSYAMPPDTIASPADRTLFTAFLFWASWVCITERPGRDYTYTSNWPPDELLGNRPPSHLLVVSVLSFVLLLGGIGALAWFYAATRESWASARIAVPQDPFIRIRPTPSMRATVKYFWLVGFLLVLQMGSGIVTAHYGVEGTALYGLPVARWLPYALTRTWHVQLGLFWIATAWLATGLCLAPLLTGHEPRFQRLGVNVLLGALVLVVVGSMAGQGLAIHQQWSPTANFWVGHQGLEYLDLGRLWQILLFGGLLFWLGLMLRCLVPGLRRSQGVNRQILLIFALSVAAIALFYGAGLLAGRDTNLAIAEYWRWWVVHLWVEGFFEVFAVAAVAFAFIRLDLVQVRSATMAVLFTTILYLSGGVLGTFHHLYFTGTGPAIIALGGTFSALELVPLVMIGYEGYENWSLHRSTSWSVHYKWPIFFLVAVAFWNLVGGRAVRLPHQSSHCPVLHAGPQYHPGPCPCRPVWRLWHAGSGPDVAEPADIDRPATVAHRCPGFCLLVHEYWFVADDSAQSAAHWPGADLGQCGTRHVVCPFRCLSATGAVADLPLAARHRGHDLCRGHAGHGLVRRGAPHRLVPAGRSSRYSRGRECSGGGIGLEAFPLSLVGQRQGQEVPDSPFRSLVSDVVTVVLLRACVGRPA